MKKRIAMIVGVLIVALCVPMVAFGAPVWSGAGSAAVREAPAPAACPNYEDVNADGTCDNAGTMCPPDAQACPRAGASAGCPANSGACPAFTDENGDGVCDGCGNAQGACPNYQDANGDGTCDNAADRPAHGRCGNGHGSGRGHGCRR
ncbi:hypothetical protein GMI69_06305 [Eggerthellaceae bacterium zg-887]|uniref:hypothetical protein n=1 Tax=Xiamenia xianingshaonis TaxID=2682776 RepID=UPI00140770DA|nr:hypothetical protein [Xiamenia xianingshaonis]NHM16269.1 hypothetical protein [Xiamenia xianingshaonis]